MRTEFSRLMTGDGFELAGLWFTPDDGVSATTVIHVHGLSGNFYENRFVEVVGSEVVGKGSNFMAFNNRGHDYISDSIYQPEIGGPVDFRQFGGAYERFEDCASDIQAFMAFARSKGSSRFLLQGHSHGALKAAWFLANNPDPAITGLILLSPSDDFGMRRKNLGNKFEGALDLARKLVKEGKENVFMPGEYSPSVMSAGSYHDTFRQNSPLMLFNLSRTDRRDFPELAGVKIPTILILGTVDEYFIGDPDDVISDLDSIMVNCPSFKGYAIRGAGHIYALHENELAGIIGDWVNRHN